MLHLRAPLVLASASPRRRELLRQLGLTFTVAHSDVEETSHDAADPDAMVQRLAREKAEAVARRHPEALTLGSDTTVVLDGENLGKPRDRDQAAEMLQRLAGRTHTVHTGVALAHPPSGRLVSAAEQTNVTFASLSPAEIDAYVATGSPLDKAGAYGIQDDLGAVFISRIDGDYYNVVGLPLHRLYRLLRDHFADLLA
jgi:septum formation protein